MTFRHRPRRLDALASGVALWLCARDALADEGLVRLRGSTSGDITRRVRGELESLGHSVTDGDPPGTEAPVAEVTFASVTGDGFDARVRVRQRAEVSVHVSATERDAEAVFALRIAEAVRAGLLAPVVVETTRTVVAVAPERRWRVGVGLTGLHAPSDVDPLFAPVLRVAWGGRWYVEARAAWPSFGGEVPSLGAGLSLLDLSLGGAVALWQGKRLRLDAGARGHALWITARRTYAGNEYTQRQWTGAVTALVALGVRLNERIALRAEVFGGVSFHVIALGFDTGPVAQWGRGLVGASAGVDFSF
jgi:hypothetical protein